MLSVECRKSKEKNEIEKLYTDYGRLCACVVCAYCLCSISYYHYQKTNITCGISKIYIHHQNKIKNIKWFAVTFELSHVFVKRKVLNRWSASIVAPFLTLLRFAAILCVINIKLGAFNTKSHANKHTDTLNTWYIQPNLSPATNNTFQLISTFITKHRKWFFIFFCFPWLFTCYLHFIFVQMYVIYPDLRTWMSLDFARLFLDTLELIFTCSSIKMKHFSCEWLFIFILHFYYSLFKETRCSMFQCVREPKNILNE